MNGTMQTNRPIVFLNQSLKVLQRLNVVTSRPWKQIETSQFALVDWSAPQICNGARLTQYFPDSLMLIRIIRGVRDLRTFTCLSHYNTSAYSIAATATFFFKVFQEFISISCATMMMQECRTQKLVTTKVYINLKVIFILASFVSEKNLASTELAVLSYHNFVSRFLHKCIRQEWRSRWHIWWLTRRLGAPLRVGGWVAPLPRGVH